MIAMQRIVVPIDFSEPSTKALRYAAAFARHFDAEVLLVYVVEPVIYPADFSFGQVAVPAVEGELRERGERELQQLLERETSGLRARAAVRIGKPYAEIVRLAEEESADLIVIATHGHSGIEHALFGSTTDKVVRKAACPVLTVRDREKDFIGE